MISDEDKAFIQRLKDVGFLLKIIMKRIKLLTQKNFKVWLESKAPKTKVGKAVDAYACPIFNFLKQNNLPVTFVGKLWGIKLKENDNYIDIPKWTERFIDTLDKSMAAGASVSAKKALEILQKI